MKKRFEELRLTGRLPSPSTIGVRILHLLRDEDYDAGELARTIQSDPALAGRILKMANSVRFGGIRSITSIADAVIRLGLHTVRNLALGFSLVSNHRDGRCRRFDYRRYWSESLARAIAAQQLADELRTVAPTEAYICGLLSGIGRLALATVHPDAYSGVLTRLGEPSPVELADAEQAAFAIDHGEVAYCMMRDWQVPELLCTAAADYWRPARGDPTDALPELRRMMEVMRVAAAITDLLVEEESSQPQRWARLEALRSELALSADELTGLGDRIAFQWCDWGRLLGITANKPASFAVIRERALDLVVLPNDPPLTSSFADDPADSEDALGDDAHRLPRLLLACADAERTMLIAEWLLGANFDVLTAPGRDEVLASTFDRSPDLLLIDADLSGGRGLETCRELRITENGRNLHIAVLATPGSSAWQQALDARADDVLDPDCDSSLLVARLRIGARLCALRQELATSQARRRQLSVRVARLQRALESANTADPLTRLRSQRFAVDRLRQAWSQSATSPMAFAMFEVDHLKQVNVQHGRDHGDDLLAEVAGVMAKQKRASDLLCRLGGPIFAILCRCDESGAMIMAERFRRLVEVHKFTTAPRGRHVTVSVGVATRAEWMRSPSDLLRAAELALIDAVKNGGNRSVASRDVAPVITRPD